MATLHRLSRRHPRYLQLATVRQEERKRQKRKPTGLKGGRLRLHRGAKLMIRDGLVLREATPAERWSFRWYPTNLKRWERAARNARVADSDPEFVMTRRPPRT